MLFFLAAAAVARQEEPRMFPVMSADPWLIKTLLEGGQADAPELSTLWLLRGMPRTTKSGGGGLLDGGHLMVNPTDNALWWIPDPKK
jgi:hypothetical protein